MDTEKVIVVLLLIAILLSVITLAITISSNVIIKATEGETQEDFTTASVVLEIVKNPAKGGVS